MGLATSYIAPTMDLASYECNGIILFYNAQLTEAAETCKAHMGNDLRNGNSILGLALI